MTEKLLVVTPAFHGYGHSVASAFRRRGYDVVVHEFDAASTSEKLWNKVRHELPAKVTGHGGHLSSALVTERAIARLRQVRPGKVLIIRGDSFMPAFWQALDESGAPSILWMYDELRRMSLDIDLVSSVSSVATYSHDDVADLARRGIEARHVADAFDSSRRPRGSWPRDEVTFVGAVMANRVELLEHVMAQDIPVRAYGRGWSRHPIDKARTWRVRSPRVPAARDVSLEEAYAIMRDSAATFNMHFDQDGFTMRTFEACGVGGVQIIDRDDVSEFYDPGTEVLVQHSLDEAVDLARQALREPRRMDALRLAARKRTLAHHTFDHRAAILDEFWS